MQQRRMLAIAKEIEQVDSRADIRRQSVAKVGIEIREAGAVDDDVERFCETLTHICSHAKVGTAHIAFDDFDSSPQESGEPFAMLGRELLEHGRFFHHAAETSEGGVGLITPDEQINSGYFREIGEEICEPHFADEAGGAYQKNIFAAERIAHGEGKPVVGSAVGLREVNDGNRNLRRWPVGGLNRTVYDFRILRVAETADKNCAGHLPVRLASCEFGESTPRTNHWIEQAASGEAVAKIEAIAENALDAEMIGERSHDVVESLAYENNVRTGCDDFFESSNPGVFQSWLEEILKEFLAEEVEPIAAYAAQDRVEKACGEHAIGGVEKRARDRKDSHCSASPPAFEKGLCVPGEEADGTDGREIQQAAFDAPVDGFCCGARIDRVALASCRWRIVDVGRHVGRC